MEDNKKKTIFPLMKENKQEESHRLYDELVLEEETPESNIPSRFQPRQNIPAPTDNSVWPSEENVNINDVRFLNGELTIYITNVQIDPIRINSMGVKYTDSLTESINFHDVDIILEPGDNEVQITCSRGSPAKFVLRTEHRTGIGAIRSNKGW